CSADPWPPRPRTPPAPRDASPSTRPPRPSPPPQRPAPGRPRSAAADAGSARARAAPPPSALPAPAAARRHAARGATDLAPARSTVCRRSSRPLPPLPERAARPRQAALRRAGLDLERGGNLLVREPLDVVQDDRLAMLVRQQREHLVDRRLLVPPRRRRRADVGVGADDLARVLPPPLAIAVERDPGQPGAERRLPAEKRQETHRAQPRLLHPVRRLRRPSHRRHQGPIHRRRLTPLQQPERL